MPTCMRIFASMIAIAIGAVSVTFTQSTTAQTVEPLTDSDAYAVYAALLPSAWAQRSKEVLLLQQETEPAYPCPPLAGQSPDAEWDTVEKNFEAANARPRVLRPMLPVDIPYRLVPQAEIKADDARLERKYPGQWQSRPGEIEYAAVSMVGFDSRKTKAIVYVRLRSSGNVYRMQKREGKWVTAPYPVCGWIA